MNTPFFEECLLASCGELKPAIIKQINIAVIAPRIPIEYAANYSIKKSEGKMRDRLRLISLALSLSCSMIPSIGLAGFDEGLAAAKKKDYATALREWKPLALQGVAAAQYNLGWMYDNGQGVLQDHKEAVKWYRLAADQGHAAAQNNLGLMYKNGQGVPQDYKEAVKWYRLAADQGGAAAQFNLGLKYHNGQGVPQDYKEAVKWYRLAADQGQAAAQNNLGWLYSKGHGIAANRVVAYALFNVSAANDPSKENKATANRADLAESIPAREIEAAQDLTREITKPGNLLKALDKYARNPAVKEKSKPVAMRDDTDPTPSSTPSGDSFPVRPAKRPGVISCNTSCVNADCRRTYDDGRKIRFQAKRKYDPFSGDWKFDSGNC